MRWQTDAFGGPAARPRRSRLELAIILILAFFSGLTGRVLSQDEEPDEEKINSKAPLKVDEINFPENLGRNLTEREGCWLPVYVELKATSREAQTVLLQGTVQGGDSPSFLARERVEVAPGAPARAWIYLRAASGQRQETASLEVRLASGAAIAKRRWTISSFWQRGTSFSMLVVAEQLGDITPWPGDLTGQRGDSLGGLEHFSVDSSPAKALPDRVLGYHGMDLVILRDLGEGKLEPAQVEALRAWVCLGGFVVLVPGSHSSEIFRTEIARELCGDALLDPKPLDGFQPQDLVFLDGKGGTRLALEKVALGEGKSFTLLDPLTSKKRGTREIFSSPRTERGKEIGEQDAGENGGLSGASRLYCELRYGQGRVGVFSLNDQTHREAGATFLRELWRRIVEWRSRDSRGSFGERAGMLLSPDLERLLNDESRDVGLVFITALIAAYLILVGPGLYFLLKRWNRLPAVIWAEPLLVVVYLGVIFATAYITKGVLTKTRIWTFISQREGESLALRESYLTIFSADDALYRVDSPRGLLLQPIFKNEKEAQPLSLSRSPQGQLVLENIKLAHWQQGHLVNVEVLDMKDREVLLKEISSGGDAGELPSTAITNHLPYPIREGILFGHGSRAMVPRIEPDQTVVVRLEKDFQQAARDLKANKEETSWRRFFSSAEDFPFQRKGFTLDGRLGFAGLLERAGEDFRLDKRSSLKERLDLYLLLRG